MNRAVCPVGHVEQPSLPVDRHVVRPGPDLGRPELLVTGGVDRADRAVIDIERIDEIPPGIVGQSTAEMGLAASRSATAIALGFLSLTGQL